MSDDVEHVLATFQRGERGEVRLTRCSFKGAVFTKLQLWFPGSDGVLHPGRQVVTIRDGELDEVIQALDRVRARVSGGARKPPTRKPPTEQESFDMAKEDAEGLF